MGAPIDDAVLAQRPERCADRSLAERLHDGLSQQLFAAELDLHELRVRADLPDDVREVLDRLSARLTAGTRQLREELHAVMAENEADHSSPLAEALTELSAMVAAECPAVTVAVQVTGRGPQPPAPGGRVLLRAAREGLANVIKHAGATHALVVLRRDPRWWIVEVHDDGRGDPAVLRASMAQRRSFGLDSLLASAGRVGGRLGVLTSPELGGILLTVAVPVHH
jgi:signal transduction histidine kinase